MLAYILNRVDYTESSGIIELWTHDLGRVVAIAKGIKRPLSQLRNALCLFQPLEITIKGKNQLKTLCRAEWVGHCSILSPRHYLFAYYLNELLIKHILREDAQVELFFVYQIVLEQLGQLNVDNLENAPHTALLLRWFEKILLDCLGYNILWSQDIYEEEIMPQAWYRVNPLKGIIPAEKGTPINQLISGDLLIHLSLCTAQSFESLEHLSIIQMKQIKGLLHFLLRFHSVQKKVIQQSSGSLKIWHEMQELKMLSF